MSVVVGPAPGGPGGGAVSSVNGHVGDVVLGAADVGAEAAGTVAAEAAARTAAIAAEAAARAAAVAAEATTRAANDVTLNTAIGAETAARIAADLALLPLDGSRAMTGGITLPGNAGVNLGATPLQQVNALIATAIANLVAGAPGILDTLGEIAAALQADEATAATLAATVAGKLAKASNLGDLLNVATAQANLSLRPGIDVQAFAANLTVFAALGLVADRLPYANGAGTLALATFTQAARDLLDDANAGAMRTTLGLGGAAVLNVGAVAGTVAAGDDARLTDQRTPLDLSVVTAKIVDKAVTLAKQADMATARIRGRVTAGVGPPEDLTAADVVGLLTADATWTEAVQDVVGALVVAAGGTYNDPAGSITFPSAAGAVTTVDKVLASTSGGVNTVAEETYYTFAIPANTFAAGDRLQFRVVFDFDQNGFAMNRQMRLKIGATTLLDTGMQSGNSSTNRKGGIYEALIGFPTTASQRGWHNARWNEMASVANVFGVANSIVGAGANPALGTEDMTAAKTLVFTVQHSAANAGNSFRLIMAELLRIR